MCAAVFQVDDPTMPDVEDTRSLLTQLVCPESPKELVRALWVVSYATLFMGLNAGLHRPAAGPVFGGHKVAYYIILAVILATVPVEMATAFWLPRSNGRRFHRFAEVLHRVAIVLLLFLSAVGGIEFTLKQ
jgi:fatty-acid desaturase